VRILAVIRKKFSLFLILQKQAETYLFYDGHSGDSSADLLYLLTPQSQTRAPGLLNVPMQNGSEVNRSYYVVEASCRLNAIHVCFADVRLFKPQRRYR